MYNQPPKLVLVTPNLPSNDNNNPTANALCYAAIACMCLSRFVPFLSLSVLLGDDFFGRPSFFNLNSLLFIATMVLLIIVRVKYPGNSVGKGLLIGYIVRTVLYIILTFLLIALFAWIISFTAYADFIDYLWELIEPF